MASFFPGGQDTWVPKVDLVDTVLAAHPNDLQNAVASLEIGGVSVQNIAYAASITPNVPAGGYVIVGVLTGNITVNAPTNALTGRRLTFRFTQDGTGGRTVTWNAVFSVTNWAINSAANAKTEATFTYDGSSWVLAANPPNGPYGSASSVVVGPTGVNLQSLGADMSGASLSDTAWTNAVTALPGGSGRIYVPPGHVKLSPFVLSAKTALEVRGAGRSSFLDIAGTATEGIRVVDCPQFTMGDLTLRSISGTLTHLFHFTTTGSAEIGIFQNLLAQKTAGTFTNAWAIGVDTALDVADTSWYNCQAESATGAGWKLGNGTGANVLNHTAYDCVAVSCLYGVQASPTKLRWHGGGMSNNTGADFKISGAGSGLIVIDGGFRSENGARFLDNQLNGTSVLTAHIEAVTVLSCSDAAGHVVHWQSPGTLLLISFETYLNAQPAQLYAHASAAPGNVAVVTTINTTWDNATPFSTIDANALQTHIGARQYSAGSPIPLTNLSLGVPSVIKSPTTSLAQTAAVATLATVTSPNDGNKHLYRVYGTVTITTHGTESINLQATYTDDNGTARTLTIPICTDAGTFATAANAAGEWLGSATISVNPNTVITLKTAGTFTGATYNATGALEQLT